MYFTGSCREYFECKEKFAKLREFADNLGLPRAVDDEVENFTRRLNWYAEFYDKWRVDVGVNHIPYGGSVIESCDFDCFCGSFGGFANARDFVRSMDLMHIRIPGVAYCFRDGCYEVLRPHFDRMIGEIVRETGPAYFDSLNNSLYYKPENAGAAFKKVTEIVHAYRKSAEEIYNKAKIADPERQPEAARGSKSEVNND